MASAEFTIRLGNGLYLDSSGRYIPGPIDSVPTLPAAGGGLPIDPANVKKTLTGISDSLGGLGEPKTRKKLNDLGVPDELIDILGKAAKIAGDLAKVVPYVGAVVAVAELLGFLKSGPDPLTLKLEQLFKELRHLIQAKDEKWTSIEVGKHRETILQGLNAANELVEELTHFAPDADAARQRLTQMRNTHQGMAESLNNLMNPSIWQSTWQSTGGWPWNLHYERHSGQPGAEDRVILPSTETDRFDHRMMVPTVTAMTESYLTFIKAIVPEYRSSGEFSEFLADLALKIESLTEIMRAQTLARTHFTRHDFTYVGADLTLGSGLVPMWKPRLGGYHVGAVDLCARNLPLPANVPYNFGWTMDSTGARVDHGAMHYNWTPPAKVELEDWGELGGRRFRVTNPEECVAAANAQAEQDYAVILHSSGYMNLIQLAGLLRHLVTAPTTSETIEVSSRVRRQPHAKTTVTVTGIQAWPLEAPTSEAKRTTYTPSARIRIGTQPQERLRVFPLKVWLRTLPVRSDGTADYADVYRTRYTSEPSSRQPGTQPFTRLETDFDATRVLGQQLVAQRTSSRPDTGSVRTSVTLAADTHDLWVPTPDAAGPGGDMSKYVGSLRALGWTASRAISGASEAVPARPTRPGPPGGPAPVSNRIRSFDWVAGSVSDALVEVELGVLNLLPAGERRDIQRRQAELTFESSWDGLDLTIEVQARPEDRCFDVYVVVEETVANGAVLHTVERVPLIGQITYVPQSFFDEEQRRIDSANDFWRDFVDKYSKSKEVSPLDPIASLTWRELTTLDGLRRAAEIASATQPEFLQSFLRERRIIAPALPAAASTRAATAVQPRNDASMSGSSET